MTDGRRVLAVLGTGTQTQVLGLGAKIEAVTGLMLYHKSGPVRV